MAEPISRRPLPRPPAAAETARAASQKTSSRNPLRRLIQWVKASRLGQAFAKAFSRPPSAAAASTARAAPSLKERRVRPTISAPLPQAAAGLRRGRNDPLPELPGEAKAGVPLRRRRTDPLPALPGAAEVQGAQKASDAERTAPLPQTVLASALHALNEESKSGELSPAQRDFLQSSVRDLAALAVRPNAASAQEVRYLLGNMSLHINMPEELGERLRTQYRPLPATAPSRGAAEAQARFLDAVDGALALTLAEAPSAEALQASKHVGALVRSQMQEFYQLDASGAGADEMREVTQFLQKLASDMRQGRASLLSSLPERLPDVAAFIRTPDYAHFLGMLDKTENGYDMMKQAWLLSQTELAPAQCERHWESYTNKRSMQAAAEPFSFLQQSEFCAQHFQTRLLPPAYDVTDSPEAEMASAVFVGERLAKQVGDAGLSGEHFAQGHMLWLAFAQKQSLPRSLAIAQAVRSDARPMAAFVLDSADNAWQPKATPEGEAALARQEEVLQAPPLSYDSLSDAASAQDFGDALDAAWPRAVASAAAETAAAAERTA